MSANHARMGNPFQPVMIGGWTTVPEAKSTGPGTAKPMPRTRAAPTCSLRSSWANLAETSVSHASGPMVMSRATVIS